MLKGMNEKYKKLKEDRASFKAMMASFILHGGLFLALLYVGVEKFIDDDTVVEFSVEGQQTETPSVGEKKEGPRAATKKVSPIEKIATSKAKTKSKIMRAKKPVAPQRVISKRQKTNSNLPADPELREIYRAEQKLKKQETEFKRQLLTQRRKAEHDKKIANAKRRLHLKQEAMKLRMHNIRKQERIKHQMAHSERQLKEQQQKLQLQKMAQSEYEETRQKLFQKQKYLNEQSQQLKGQLTNIKQKSALNQRLAEEQQRLALEQEALKQEVAQEKAIAEKTTILAAQRRAVEAAEARAIMQSEAQERARTSRLSLQNQEAALRMRAQRAQVAEQKYGINLPNGARSVTDLKQRPGNRGPSYPIQARKNGWQGEGLVLYYVTSHGTVRNAQMVNSTGYPALDKVAVETFNTYRFYPGQSGWTYHPIRFSLKSNNANEMADY